MKYRRDSGETYRLSSATSTMWCLWEPFLKVAGSQLSGEFRSAWMVLLVLKIVSFCSCKTIITCYCLTASQMPGSKCCKEWGHTKYFSYLVCLCLLWLYPGLLVVFIVFFLFFIRENPKSSSYLLIYKCTTEENILLSFHFIYEEKFLVCILHYEIFWPQRKRSGKHMQNKLMLFKTPRENSSKWRRSD